MHFTVTVSMRFSALVLERKTILFKSFSAPLGVYRPQGNRSAPKAFSLKKSISTLEGTHLYPWVKRKLLKDPSAMTGI